MNERTTKTISILVSMAGLALLYYVSLSLGTIVNITDINIEDIGRKFSICGNITSHRTSNNHIFLTIEDGTAGMSFVIFNSSMKTLERMGINQTDFVKNKAICISGTVDEYPKGSGNLEMVYGGGDIDIH
jgi:DNA/RNA endonuclease YhcR with UshA esterase domain